MAKMATDEIKRWMEIAKSKIKYSEHPRLKYFHGCVIVDKHGNVISSGGNKNSLPKDVLEIEKILGSSKVGSIRFDSIGRIHAEVEAFYNLNLDHRLIRGSTLVVYGESKAGTVVKSRPCANCMRLAEYFRVSRVIYSNTKNTITIEDL